MSLESLETTARGECPVCAAPIIPCARVEETEILPCPECQTQLVVDRCEGYRLVLCQAPRIEEDWGE